ncbi:MAG: hypothetical protein EB034_12775, partial [Verrucomicrobia bacterium]|nr:hypothetical protein [Verrucomicrobiota bacterium]
ILFSNVTAMAQPGRRAGLIWGLPEMAVTNVVFQQVTLTADKPLGIYNAHGKLLETVTTAFAGPREISRREEDEKHENERR